MLKKHSQLFESLLLISDLVIIAFSWLFSYYVRFHSGLLPVHHGAPGLLPYSLQLAPIVVIWAFVFKWFGLYRPKRTGSQLKEVLEIARACSVSTLVFIAFTFFARHHEYSRLVIVLFTLFNIAALSMARLVFRLALAAIRRKGFNLRYAVVAGTGESARRVLERIDAHPEVGIKVEGLISTGKSEEGRLVSGVRVIGSLDKIREIIRDGSIDIVFIALSWNESARMEEAVRGIGDETVDIKVIPDINDLMTLRGGVEEFDGLAILNLRNSPLYGWNMIMKRALDVAVSLVAIALLAPFMLLIAVLIKLTSPGPVLYTQERMGIGGDIFRIFKFRTMSVDAEASSGAVWARKGDPRRTMPGTVLRATSLDELPQLFNVLKGDMSLVGPRPERPVFIQEFRREIPGYMLRHKMKSGITGWAQVNGWRGNTDLVKRIEHDLYYIEHWSISFDLKILVLTFWKGFVNRNAY